MLRRMGVLAVAPPILDLSDSDEVEEAMASGEESGWEEVEDEDSLAEVRRQFSMVPGSTCGHCGMCDTESAGNVTYCKSCVEAYLLIMHGTTQDPANTQPEPEPATIQIQQTLDEKLPEHAGRAVKLAAAAADNAQSEPEPEPVKPTIQIQ